jgi:hypothetical protein
MTLDAHAYNRRFFASVEKENAFILRQLALVEDHALTHYTPAQWIALKLSLTEAQAQQKIERACGLTEGYEEEEDTQGASLTMA